MEKKLEAYRQQKRRQAIINNLKEKFFNMVSFQPVTNNQSKSDHVIVQAEDNVKSKLDSGSSEEYMEDDELLYSETESVTSSMPDVENDATINQNDKKESDWFQIITYCLYFLFWVTCYAIAIQLQFGTVYLLLSGILGIYFNTRTSKRNKNEISAYSVFNKNCHSIDGTLKAEQFENELRYGAINNMK